MRLVQTCQLHRSSRLSLSHPATLLDLPTFSWVPANIRNPTDALKVTRRASTRLAYLLRALRDHRFRMQAAVLNRFRRRATTSITFACAWR